MKVLIINSVCGIGSTGRICTDLAQEFEQNGDEVKIAYGRSKYVPEQVRKYAVQIGNSFDVMFHMLKTRLTDTHGLGSTRATKKFLKWAEEYNPELLWLHNLHGYYINYELLFSWIKSRPEMQVKWTLHDCWAFTGHCSYFTMAKCDKWKISCYQCPQKNRYPKSFLDNSKKNFERKKRAFTGVDAIQLITPSQWLAGLVKQSFLKKYPIEVRYNAIDTGIFKPTPSDFRERYNLEDKKIILGVASVWDERKGLNDFIKLSELLDNKYIIVLVGLNKKQIKRMPKNVLGIERTHNPYELAEIYTASDIFLNLSKEETFGMTTLEAKSCGTQVVVYKDTACEEVVEKCGGYVVEQGDIEKIKYLLDFEDNLENKGN